MTPPLLGLGEAFAKELTCLNEESVWKPERLSRENSIYKILGCEIAWLILGLESNSRKQRGGQTARKLEG